MQQTDSQNRENLNLAKLSEFTVYVSLWWCLKCVIVYLARDIPAFVMYCVNGASRSSLLIESTDSMIHSAAHIVYTFQLYLCIDTHTYCTYMYH